ncbi:MAG: Fe-S cluster protein [Planctomycetes bacterium]|nr:Fe-S cluster protein [Planctomycetota bacterium]
MRERTVDDLPGLNCGLCGQKTCADLAARLARQPDLIKRCVPLSQSSMKAAKAAAPTAVAAAPAVAGGCSAGSCASCGTAGGAAGALAQPTMVAADGTEGTPRGDDAWCDSLGRQFDFFLEHFPEDPGPREIILPHNPMLTREMDVRVGEILIGRPLGMSCGCPITHCGIVTQVDQRTGVMTWCVTGPLQPRQQGFKDIGYYIAEGYEGLISDSRCEIKIGMRYFFQPRRCMLQWRHSGLVNFLNRTRDGLQVRLEGLWIG